MFVKKWARKGLMYCQWQLNDRVLLGLFKYSLPKDRNTTGRCLCLILFQNRLAISQTLKEIKAMLLSLCSLSTSSSPNRSWIIHWNTHDDSNSHHRATICLRNRLKMLLILVKEHHLLNCMLLSSSIHRCQSQKPKDHSKNVNFVIQNSHQRSQDEEMNLRYLNQQH